MKRLTQIFAALLVILTGAQLYAQQAKYLCTKMNGVQVKATACEALILPTASPLPMPTSTPSSPLDCSGGTFVSATPTSVKLTGRTYPYSQSVKMCANVLAGTQGFMTLSSVNHSNASCNVMHVTLTSPSGRRYETESTQPGVAMTAESGKWSIVATLTDNAPCAANHTFDFYLQW